MLPRPKKTNRLFYFFLIVAVLALPVATGALNSDGSDYPRVMFDHPDACVIQYSVTGGTQSQRESLGSIVQGVASLVGVPSQDMGSSYPAQSDISKDYIYRIEIDQGYSGGANVGALAYSRKRGTRIIIYQSGLANLGVLGMHEMGHALGLDHNPSEPNGMMAAKAGYANYWTQWELAALKANTARMRDPNQCWLSPDADRNLIGGPVTTPTNPTTPTSIVPTNPTNPTNPTSPTSPTTPTVPVTTRISVPVTTRITVPTTKPPTTAPTVLSSYDQNIKIVRTGPVAFPSGGTRYRYIVQNTSSLPLSNIYIFDKASSNQPFNHVATIPNLGAGKTTVILAQPISGNQSGLPCQAYYIPPGAKAGKGVACR